MQTRDKVLNMSFEEREARGNALLARKNNKEQLTEDEADELLEIIVQRSVSVHKQM